MTGYNVHEVDLEIRRLLERNMNLGIQIRDLQKKNKKLRKKLKEYRNDRTS